MNYIYLHVYKWRHLIGFVYIQRHTTQDKAIVYNLKRQVIGRYITSLTDKFPKDARIEEIKEFLPEATWFREMERVEDP